MSKSDETAHHWCPDTRPQEYSENAPDTVKGPRESAQKAPRFLTKDHQSPEHCSLSAFPHNA